MELNIYSKNDNLLATVIVGSNSYVFTQIMGDNYLQLEFSHGEYIDIRRDAYVTYQGVKYILTGAVNVEKISTVEYNYSARFEAPQELLENVIMSHMSGEDQNLTKAYERNFSLAGTALEHIMMLWRNTERLGEMFNEPTEANIDPALTGVKVVGYNVVSCKSALQLIANQFETEWWITGNETNGYDIHLGKCSFDENNATKLAYGYDNGVLSGAKRQLHKDAQRMTHIAVQGGSKNINTLSQLTDVNGNPIAPYKFSTLHLPRLSNADENGVGKIYYDVKNNKFYGETGFNMVNAVLLTIDRDANTMTSSLFTDGDVIVEKAYDLSEFYPKKTRSVSTWGFQRNNTEFYVTDNSIENACNYKSYQLGGEKITIEFQSGALAGKSFDVINYDHTNKKFECSLADYDTISMPSVSDDYDMWRPTEGDEFIVFGCALPKTYIADTSTDPFSGAEWDMARRTASILCDNYEDKYAYTLQIDSNWLSRRTESERAKLKCGYWVHFSDNQLAGGGIDIRITDVKQYLTRPLQPELTIGDEVKQVSIAQKLNQIASNVSATYNYVQNVEQETQQAIQQVQQSGGGGDVTITNTLQSGTLIATINGTDIKSPNNFAPTTHTHSSIVRQDGSVVNKFGYSNATNGFAIQAQIDGSTKLEFGYNSSSSRYYVSAVSGSTYYTLADLVFEGEEHHYRYAGRESIGNSTTPVYLDNGEFKACSLPSQTSYNAMTSTQFKRATSTEAMVISPKTLSECVNEGRLLLMYRLGINIKRGTTEYTIQSVQNGLPSTVSVSVTYNSTLNCLQVSMSDTTGTILNWGDISTSVSSNTSYVPVITDMRSYTTDREATFNLYVKKITDYSTYQPNELSQNSQAIQVIFTFYSEKNVKRSDITW